MSHPADKFISHRDLPRGIIRSCKLCKHFDSVTKPRSPGRGWGMREGNKQRGRLIQHIKQAHPQILADCEVVS